MTPPNGCLFCGALWRDHGRRYDRQHPPGVTGYVEPSDRIRRLRMIRNRAERVLRARKIRR